MTVSYCKNSTISEAWALVTGLPASLDENEVAAVAHRARTQFEMTPGEPSAVILLPGKWSESVPPHWQHQMSWGEGKLMARTGHRFLSVHFIKQPELRYETYEQSLKPAVVAWLSILKDTLRQRPDEYPVNRVAFGYKNTFEYDAASFALSDHFKVNVTHGLSSATEGILGLDVAFRFFHEQFGADLAVSLEAGMGTTEGTLRVSTKVVAELNGLQDISFKDDTRILEQVATARLAARTTFFQYATEQTHKLMEAQYVADPQIG